MAIARRTLFRVIGSGAAASFVSRRGLADTYPSGPVRIVVGFPPGGPTDITARLIARWLSSRFGQPFIVENRPGAGGNVGTANVANAAPDGRTLLLVITSNAINATLYRTLSFDFLRDIATIAGMVSYPLVMAVSPAVSATSVPEFIALAKANPGRLNMASGGNGSIMHTAGELFKMMAGVDLLHVPYRGVAPALTDLIAGHAHVMFDALHSSIEHIRAGQLRALAVTSAMRANALPQVPTIGDFVDGYVVNGWAGVGAPRGTPSAVIERLAREVHAGLSDPTLRSELSSAGYIAMPLGSEEFKAFIADETEKWANVVKFSGGQIN
jgi:tripartite-type tricarboxylate transporter receptor subunit TctC